MVISASSVIESEDVTLAVLTTFNLYVRRPSVVGGVPNEIYLVLASYEIQLCPVKDTAVGPTLGL
jgi:hypothetical protein